MTMTTIRAGSPEGLTRTSTYTSQPPWTNGEPSSAWRASRPRQRVIGRSGWLQSFGTLELVGVEGTGSYGAGLTRHLHAPGRRGRRGGPPQPSAPPAQGQVRPPRRRRGGRAAQGGDANGPAKTRDGNVESMRVLRVARSSARSSRTQAINQMRSLDLDRSRRAAGRTAGSLHLQDPHLAVLIATADGPT